MMVENVKIKVNCGTLLCELKIELTHNATSEPKKPKVENTYQPTKAQRKLFDVCIFRDFKTLPNFKYVP
jgi:hypothetical protein